MLTVPNGVKGFSRKALRGIGPDGFSDLCHQIALNMAKSFGRKSGYKPNLRVHHRHFLGQKKSVTDGLMDADLRTAAGDEGLGIKPQPHWFDAAYALVTDKQGCNVQLQLGVYIPYSSTLLQKKGALGVHRSGLGSVQACDRLAP